MISLVIKDGLGNQLFQYAFARYLQELYKERGIVEEIAINPLYMNTNDFRKVSLHHFKLNEHVRFMDEGEQRKDLIDFKLKVLLANGVDLIPWKITKTHKPLGQEKFIKRAIKGMYYTYDPQTNFGAPLSSAKVKYVFGCYQGVENFKPIKEIIKDEFQVVTPMKVESQKVLDNIIANESVCLHIRRGDYLNDRWKNLQVCNFDYYNDALNEVLSKVDKPVFYVFSNSHDDIEWIKNNYHFVNRINDKPLHVFYVDLENQDYEELNLMKNCKHFIISNSTFSWWAAFLSENSKKLVCAPERWNLTYTDDSSIYLDGWSKIKLRRG